MIDLKVPLLAGGANAAGQHPPAEPPPPAGPPPASVVEGGDGGDGGGDGGDGGDGGGEAEDAPQASIPPLPEDTEAVLTFLSGGEDWEGRIAEWESGDLLRQTTVLLSHGGAVASEQRVVFAELEATMTSDEAAAQEELQKTQAAIPVEEARIFDELRANNAS